MNIKEKIEKLLPKIEDGLLRWIYRLITHNNNLKLENININVKRGQILLVDFGYGLGSEFRYPHYCIALHNSKKHSSKVTVIPITSKKGKYNVPIGRLFNDSYEKRLMELEHATQIKINECRKTCDELGYSLDNYAIGSTRQIYEIYAPKVKHLIDNVDNEMLKGKLKKLLKNLEGLNKTLDKEIRILEIDSYAKVRDISTISKSRIITPRTNRDLLYTVLANNRILDTIDQAIVNGLTNYKG